MMTGHCRIGVRLKAGPMSILKPAGTLDGAHRAMPQAAPLDNAPPAFALPTQETGR